MTKFIEIYDPKKRNEIIEENLRLRKKLQNKYEGHQITQNEIEENRVELFKPIIESNQILQNELIEDRNKIIETLRKASSASETLNNFNQLKIEDKPIEKQSLDNDRRESLAIEEKKSKDLVVSKLIANYLKDTTNRSNAGYSIRYDSEKNCYSIGNKVVEIENNNLKITDKIYNATNGLLELLLKKSPNFTLISDTDKQFYKEILMDSNGIHYGFDSNNKRYNSDRSEKWKFIKNELFVTSNEINQKTGSSLNVEFLPSDPNSLVEMLQLSIASYQAGNKNEYNKINCILDELVKIKTIKKRQLKTIYKNIGF